MPRSPCRSTGRLATPALTAAALLVAMLGCSAPLATPATAPEGAHADEAPVDSPAEDPPETSAADSPSGDSAEGEPEHPCYQVELIVDGWRQIPDGSGGEPVHWAATINEVIPEDESFLPLKLPAVEDSTFVWFIDETYGLENAVASQHDPDVRGSLIAHGIVREAARGFFDDHETMIKHSITELSSPANAESYLVDRARYSCIFTAEVWSVEVPGGDAARPSSTTGLGQRIRHEDPVVAEQVSWTRGNRRHTLAIFWAIPPDRALLEDLVRQLGPLDTGADLPFGGADEVPSDPS